MPLSPRPVHRLPGRDDRRHRPGGDFAGLIAGGDVESDRTNRRPVMTGGVSGRWVAVPTKGDRASIDGLRDLATQIRHARQTNHDLAILGAVLFGSGYSSTTIPANAVDAMTDVLGAASTVFASTVQGQ